MTAGDHLSPQTLATAGRFDVAYRLGQTAPLRDIERTVCGCAYGATSWTTRAEADALGRHLRLTAQSRMLEVGCGAGWPALYLTRAFGCETTLSDVSSEGLRIAAARAAEDGVAGRCTFVDAPGHALPFADGAFDAICHSDVLCCLEEKREMLEECRRVIAAGGRMAFSVIHLAEGMSAAAIRKTVASGPTLVEAPAPYADMLGAAGWHIEDEVDIAAAFADAVEAIAREYEAGAAALSELLGREEFEAELAKHRGKAAAIAAGHLKRTIFVATPAGI